MWLDYYSILLLIHRPDSNEKRLLPKVTSTDATICHLASSEICRLIEGLKEKGQIQCLPSHIVHIAFTALVQLFVATRLSTSITPNGSVRKYESLRGSMKAMADFWPHSDTILSRFEESIEVLISHQDKVAADLTEIEQLPAIAGAPSSEDSDVMDEEQIVKLVGDIAHLREDQPIRVWRQWRQWYWRWTHIRCF